MSTPNADLSWDEVMKLAAVNRDQLLERIHDHTRPQLHKAAPRRVSLLRWTWQLTDARYDRELASGRAWSQWAAWRRCHRAYLKELGK